MIKYAKNKLAENLLPIYLFIISLFFTIFVAIFTKK